MINEFGEVGIDHLLVGEIALDVVLLKSGCVCCSIRGELKDAFVRLFTRRQKGEVPPFRRVMVKTTGLADPAPIAATLLADPVLRHHFRLHRGGAWINSRLNVRLRCSRVACEPISIQRSGRDLEDAGAIFAGDLKGPKARILLMVALSDPSARTRLREVFHTMAP